MYAGRVIEWGVRDDVITAPRHPYTVGLMEASPTLEAEQDRYVVIPGQPPDLADLPEGCPFQPRCRHARPACADVDMALDRRAPLHGSACPFSNGEL